MARRAPHGSWASPITPEVVLSASVGLGGPVLAGGDLWWSELRPSEGGRVQLVRKPVSGDPVDVLPEGFSARTRVHEYGGGAWWVHDQVVYFASWEDQRLHQLVPGRSPVALTPEPEVPAGDRYADGVLTLGGRWTVCVRERHRPGREAVNELVAVSTRPPVYGQPAEPTVLWSGPDFVSHPRISPDGEAISWLQWDHPNMPWDGTELWVGRLVHDRAGLGIEQAQRVAGGRDESLAQPRWGPDGCLHVVSDRDGWWNLWSFPMAGVPAPGSLAPRSRVRGELAQPQWVFGQSWWCFTAIGDVVGSWRFDGTDHLGILRRGVDEPEWLDVPWTSIDGVTGGDGSRVALLAGSFTSEPEVVMLEDPAVSGDHVVHRPARDLGIDPSWFSQPEPIDFPTTGGRTAHALYYPPTNPEHEGPDDERPPLLVRGHGGPTAAARPLLDLGIQVWTSRGWGVVDVNYGGSTGYGRPFRRQLVDAWGVVDVDDVCAAASFLGARGDVDPDRMAIQGSSAGGFTVLAALARRQVFAAGISRYGVADLEALARDTHKFESRYLDSLIGPYPEARDVYVERSPLSHLDGFDRPLLVLQGLEDEIVPPGQAEMIVEALRAKDVPVAYLAFEGEQHGFRRADTIERALQAELYVLARVFGYAPADDLPSVPIDGEEHLPAAAGRAGGSDR